MLQWHRRNNRTPLSCDKGLQPSRVDGDQQLKRFELCTWDNTLSLVFF
jgi:hypothetical protein